MQAANIDQREFTCFPHQTNRIEEWALGMHRRFGGTIAIALELAKGRIVYALQKYDFFVLFPINSFTLAKIGKPLNPAVPKTISAMQSLRWNCCYGMPIGLGLSSHKVWQCARC